ncbi:MAG TPA: aspartate--tRNA ligase [Chloroflexota bacterium]|nr:aspartate--tRNA ligase [Chloroflexota bacterium]
MLFTRTHHCGDLRATDVGQTVNVMGWVHRRRDHGGLIFIDLRDRSGLIQVVVDPQEAPEAHAVADQARPEFVLAVQGPLVRREAGRENPNLPTGEVEVHAKVIELLNPAKPLPFEVNRDTDVDESVRLRYRYLDLRRERLKRNIEVRHQVIRTMRSYLDDNGFVEIETPILINSTPEGARDYLVPSRVHPGEFYALPQSPQQMKQMLMVAGMDRYYQIARCFRDEDLRGDRQPEFTQLDLEMSFVRREDVMDMVEGLYVAVADRCTSRKLQSRTFPRIPYEEAMRRWGSDKPDLRFGVELVDLSEDVRATQFNAFASVLASGGQVKGIVAPGWASLTRKETDALIEQAKQWGAKGLVTLAVEADGLRGGAAKFLAEDETKRIVERSGAQVGDMLLIVADTPERTADVLSRLRLEVGRRCGLIDDHVLAFCWIIDFPLLEWVPEENRWTFMHNPFCSAVVMDADAIRADPGGIRSNQYDLACNGYEIGGGSIRIHKPEVQRVIYELMGYTPEQTEASIGAMLEAFEYGAPPHGGIATGIDRTVMMMTGETNIRETIAFPKNQAAQDLLWRAPSPVAQKQLDELHIAVVPEED